MGLHDIFIRTVFNDRSIGSDLDFADIKTNKQSKRPKIYVKPKDFSDNIFYWLVWDYNEEKGYITRPIDYKFLSENKIATSIYLTHIKEKAIFKTMLLTELKDTYEQLITKLGLTAL